MPFPTFGDYQQPPPAPVAPELDYEAAKRAVAATTLYQGFTPAAKEAVDTELKAAFDRAGAGTGPTVTPSMIEHGPWNIQGRDAANQQRAHDLASGRVVDRSKLNPEYQALLNARNVTDDHIAEVAWGMYSVRDPHITKKQAVEKWLADASKVEDLSWIEKDGGATRGNAG